MIRLTILVLLLILSGCKQADSGVRLGASNYFLEDEDRSHIYITKRTRDKSFVAVDQMVVDYKIDGHYLFVLQKVATSYDCQSKNGKAVIVTTYTNRDAYWIVDMKASLEFGPFDKQAYLGKAKSMGLAVPSLNAPSDYFTNEEAAQTDGSSCIPIEHGSHESINSVRRNP